MLKRIARKILPRGTKREKWAKLLASKLGLTHHPYYDYDYQQWIVHTETESFLPVIKHEENTPLFSIVVPFFNTPDKYLLALIDSISNQSFQNWELIVADASTNKKRSRAIESAVKFDDRLKYHRLENNTGISGNTNEGLEFATGEYVVFCDHDDVLSPHALNEMAHRVLENPKADILYSDEDKLSDDGQWRHSPLFKPRWSPHTFMYTNYTNHLSVVRRGLVEKAGGLRPEFDGSQDYDLLLRIHSQSDEPLTVEHINKVLYHWREAEGSTAINHNSKSYAFEAGRKALQEHVDRSSVEGHVENIDDRPGFYRHILYPRAKTRAVIYVAPSESIRTNEIVAARLESLTRCEKVEFEFKAVSPEGLEEAPNQIDNNTVVFKLKTIAYPEDQGWLEQMVGALELPDIECVSPRILSADGGRIVDMGLVAGSGRKIPLFKNLARTDQTLAGHTEWVRDVDELTGSIVGYSASPPDHNSYSVVWSYVNFRKKHIYSENDRYFNANLRLRSDDKVIINE